MHTLHKVNLLYECLKSIIFLSECIASTDCPAGGTNYVCNANKCDCPSPMVLDGNKCVGMLSFNNVKLQNKNCNFCFMQGKKINLLSDYLKVITFFLECITSTDCPAGGINYVCNANECNCPMPKVLDGNKCVGKLQFEKEKLLKYELQF